MRINPSQTFSGIPPLLWAVIAILLFLAFRSQNELLGLSAVVVLAAGVAMLWRIDNSRILVYLFVYQWTQASAMTFQAAFHREPIQDFTVQGGQVDLSTALTLIGVLVSAIGILAATRGPAFDRVLVASRGRLIDIPPHKWLLLYGAALLAALLLQGLAGLSPALRTIFLAAANLKWAFFWLVCYTTLAKPKQPRVPLVIAIVVELGLSFGGFFSDFKTVFIVLALALLSTRRGKSFRLSVAVSLIMVIVIYLGCVWSAVKKEYRQYLSFANSQRIAVGYQDRATKLLDLISHVESHDVAEGFDLLVSRIGYVEYFGLVLDEVPRFVPHEGGKIWLDALTRPFTPRILFPEKESIDDSQRTSKYVGYNVTGLEGDTSISIGYIGESYIDFGQYWMFLPIFLWGYVLGRINRYLAASSRVHGPVGQALAIAVLYPAAALESSVTKAFGGVMASFLVAWVLAQFVLPKVLSIMAKDKDAVTQRSRASGRVY